MLMKVKSNIESTKFRDEGNILYKNCMFFEALTCYNKSLCYAKPNSTNMALNYANRSAVYLAVNQHDKCLENIELAFKHGYLDYQKLRERKVRCLAAQKSFKADPNENPWTFFKLSYPPSEKVPYIVNCLELRTTRNTGRSIFTNRDLKTGDIIAIEKPYMKFLLPDERFRFCSHCLQSNCLSLIPCIGKCTFTMFCSEACRDEANKIYHRFECSNIHKIYGENLPPALLSLSNQRFALEALNSCGKDFAKLEALMKTPELNSKTVFDVDFSDPSKMNEGNLLAINSLIAKSDFGIHAAKLKDVLKIARSNVKTICKTDREFQILNDFSWKICQLRDSNTYSLHYYRLLADEDNTSSYCFGSALFPFASMFNHSCAPNVSRINVEDRMVFVVQRPIKKNSQLFICYRKEALFEESPRFERILTMKEDYNFRCECEACTKNYPLLDELKMFDENFWDALTVEDGTSTFDEFKRGCAYIDKNIKQYPCYELSVMMKRNHGVMKMMGRISPFFSGI